MPPSLERHPLITIALHDLRSSYSRFVFVIAAMALGIAALVGVRGAGESVRRQFLQDTRSLLAADVLVQSPVYPTPEQQKAVAHMKGVVSTVTAETMTMASGAPGSRPQIADLNIVNPAKYPFYGRVRLQPPQPLGQALTPASIAVSQTLLDRLGLHVGSTIHIAGHDFRVSAVLVSQPDRLFNDNPMSLPVLMSDSAFARTALQETGRRISTRYLFKLSNPAEVEKIDAELKTLFPGTRITDFRQGRPELSNAIDRATHGLSMICLFALVLACAGLAMTMRSHLRERLDSIATMKSLGATFRQVLGIYLAQILLLALIGSLTGIALGFGLEILLLHFAHSFFSGSISAAWTWQTSVEALITGVLSTLLLTLPVLLSVRGIKPLLILRRDFEPETRHRWQIALFSLPILVGLGLIALWLSDSLRIAEFFLAGLLAAVAALTIAALIVLHVTRVVARAGSRLSFLANYAVKSLSRPGNQTVAVLVSLGIAAGFTLGVFLIQRTVLQELSERVPETLPNLILAGITSHERPGLEHLLAQSTELKQSPEFVPMAPARVVEINGRPAEQVLPSHHARHLIAARPVAGLDAPPSGAKVMQGSWWNGPIAPDRVAVREDIAQRLHLSPGSNLAFEVGERRLPVTVAAIYKWQDRSLASGFDFILPLRAFADVPVLYVAGVSLKPGSSETRLQDAIYKAFPSVTIFDLSDILHAFEAITDELTLIVKSLAAFVVAAGLGLLGASIAGDRLERSREVVFLKSIGATRGQLIAMSSIEFLLLGLLAGGIGATFAASFASLMAKRLFQFTLHMPWGLILAGLFISAALSIVVGWLASYRVLRLRPNEALR